MAQVNPLAPPSVNPLSQMPEQPYRPQNPSYGKRPDGTIKGTGWLGELKMRDGSNNVATEMTIGVNLDGQETNIPMIVPTLAPDELDHLLKGGKPTKQIVDKAVQHAISQMRNGQSPYYQDGQ